MYHDTLADAISDIARLRELTFYTGVGFIQPDSAIIDLGSGVGDAIEPFVRACDHTNSFVFADYDEDYLKDARGLYGEDIRARFVNIDLTKVFPTYPASLIMAVCTLQYIPLGLRWRILRSAYKALLPGGALILAERVIAPGCLSEMYENMNASLILSKGGCIATAEDSKPKCTPISFTENEMLLRDAGFLIVDCFYKALNYAAWVAVKVE